MRIATFVRSLLVLRTLLITQPQSAWMLTELQTATEGWFCNGVVPFQYINQSP